VGNEVTLTFGGDARTLSQATQRATADVTAMADAVESTAGDFEEAGKSGGGSATASGKSPAPRRACPPPWTTPAGR
jgi:hypothetical protein